MTFRTSLPLIVSVMTGVLILGKQSSIGPIIGVHADTSSDTALALIQEEVRAVKSIDRFVVTHQVDVTSVTTHYNRTTHAYVKTWVQRPGHIRAESQQYARNETIVSDGSATWFYNGSNRKYWEQPGSAPIALYSNAFPGLARQLSNANLLSVVTSARLAGTEWLTIDGRSHLCDRVDVTVAPNASDSTLQDNTLHLWISREYKVPFKVEAVFLGAMPGDLKKYSDYVTDFETDLNIPASTWTFTPPPDVRQ